MRRFSTKKRDNRDNEDDQSNKNPRLEITRADSEIGMDIDNLGRPSLTPSPSSTCPSPTYSISNNYNPQQYFLQETAIVSSNVSSQSEVSNGLENLILNNTSGRSNNICLKESAVSSTIKGTFTVAQGFNEFAPLVGSFFKLGEEIIKLYESARHNKELCGFLLKRCNCAIAAVRDLDIRKSENVEFFSKKENLTLFIGFVECMKKMKKFITRVSKLNRLVKYFLAASIEDDFKNLVEEFDGYMNSLKFSFIIQSREELSKLSKMSDEIGQIKEAVFNALEIPVDKQSCQEFLDKLDSVTDKNIKFQILEQKKSSNSNLNIDSSDIEEAEPLLDWQFQKSYITSKKIEKYTSFSRCEEYFFKEFSNASSSSPEQSQIEIRRQVNILKELKNSDHIIRFYGVAKEDSKYYLVTEWMEHGNLHEYYSTFGNSINLKTKIKFALDICRGVAYLHECKILHRDIQSANILVNGHHKVRIANFGLSKNFSDITRNITHNLENIRYMAPEKLLLDNEEDSCNVKPKKVPYDAKCEIYSVGALMWEIAELKKPHSDLKKEDMLVSIRKRVIDGSALPFSKDIPSEWEFLVSRAMEYNPLFRLNISEICRDFYKMSKKYSASISLTEIKPTENHHEPASTYNIDPSASLPYTTVKILTVEDAVRIHKSENGSKQLAWHSFKYHSSTDLEAKYWLGYYYYHDKEIQELQKINKEKRIQTAVEIFKETADKGNPSAQLRYGMCLWQGEGVKTNSIEALKYLKESAKSGNSAAMYIIGKAYWNGGNGIVQDKNQGALYLRSAAKKDHPKAREMCKAYNIM